MIALSDQTRFERELRIQLAAHDVAVCFRLNALKPKQRLVLDDVFALFDENLANDATLIVLHRLSIRLRLDVPSRDNRLIEFGNGGPNASDAERQTDDRVSGDRDRPPI